MKYTSKIIFLLFLLLISSCSKENLKEGISERNSYPQVMTNLVDNLNFYIENLNVSYTAYQECLAGEGDLNLCTTPESQTNLGSYETSYNLAWVHYTTNFTDPETQFLNDFNNHPNNKRRFLEGIINDEGNIPPLNSTNGTNPCTEIANEQLERANRLGEAYGSIFGRKVGMAMETALVYFALENWCDCIEATYGSEWGC